MADMQNLAEVRANLVEVKLGSDKGPYEVSVELKVGHDWIPVTSARTGSDLLARIVGGRMAEGRLVTNQSSAAVIKKALGLSGSAPVNALAVGTQATPMSMTIHDPADGASEAHDVYFPAVVFDEVGFNLTGAGTRNLTLPFKALRDSNGLTFRIGPAA